jgi:hypothetical protein
MEVYMEQSYRNNINYLEEYRLNELKIYQQYRNAIIYGFIMFFLFGFLAAITPTPWILIIFAICGPIVAVFCDNKKDKILFNAKKYIKSNLLKSIFKEVYKLNIVEDRILPLKEHKKAELLYPNINVKEDIFSYKLPNNSLKIKYANYIYKFKGHRNTVFKGIILEKTFSHDIVNGTLFGASKNSDLEVPAILQYIGGVLNITNIKINGKKLNKQITNNLELDNLYEFCSNVDIQQLLNEHLLSLINLITNINKTCGTSVQFILQNNTLTIYLADYYSNLVLNDSYLLYDKMEKSLLDKELYNNTIKQIDIIKSLEDIDCCE